MTDDELIIDVFSSEMESLAMDMEEIESSESVEDDESNELNENEISLKEFVKMALRSGESQENYSEVVVNNFDSFDTPLDNCSAFTIVSLLIFFFLALTTIGGVLND